MADLDLATENFLGTADGQASADLRATLALATRYLANWYKATKGSENQDIWWQKIDALRAKVEATYSELLQPANATFPGNTEVADYNDASASWAQLWRELMLSADTIDVALISQLADLGTTIINAPGLLVPQIADSLGKALGDSAARFFDQAWPFLLAAAVVGGVYVFRRPLVFVAERLAMKGVG